MLVTSLGIEELLDRFRHQSTFDFMILFVSSFDYADNHIIRWVVDNAKRIDKITGERICFFYFTEEQSNMRGMFDEQRTSPISKWVEGGFPLFSIGARATEGTATDICRTFRIERTMLPAFILIEKDSRVNPQLYPVSRYEDFEAFLTPLNILHSYIEDYKEIYHALEGDIDEENLCHKKIERRIWELSTEILELKTELLKIELQQEDDEEIRRFKEREISRHHAERERMEDKLYQTRNLPAPEIKYNWERIRRKTIGRLNEALHCWEGDDIIEAVDSGFYTEAILSIWNHATQRGDWPSVIYENIRRSVLEKRYNIFISCKSEDYDKARKLQTFLKNNGHHPFLADTSIREMGNVHQTALIGEVLNVCQTMIVLTTNVEYLNTPYVYAEWTAFINDMNTGKKKRARLFNVIDPDIDIKSLPQWLRDKQCFTTENYLEEILYFL